MRELNDREKEKLKSFSGAIDRRINEVGFFGRFLVNTKFRKSIMMESVEAFLTSSKKEIDDSFVSERE